MDNKNIKKIIAVKKINLSKNYLKDAKTLLNKAGIDQEASRYIDGKIVSEASKKEYLSALEALKALFIAKEKIDSSFLKKKIKNISIYNKILTELDIGKDKDFLLNLLKSVYDILYLGNYYRVLQDKKSIDSGFEKVEKIIKIVENYVK